MKQVSKTLVLIAVAMLISTAVIAQVPSFNVTAPFASSNMATNLIRNSSKRVVRDRTRPSAQAGGLSALLDPGVSARGSIADYRATSYKADKSITRQVRSEFISRMSDAEPGSARQALAAYPELNIDRAYKEVTRSFGLSPNSFSDAMTAHMVLGWLIANDVADPPAGSVEAVRRQMAATINESDGYKTDSERQRLSEELKIMFVLAFSGWRDAVKNGGASGRNSYADGVNQLWKTKFGRDLRDVKLTAQGFSEA
ncbi:MAG: DUF6683 family protein [Pacificimonas sp.]